MEKVNLVYYNFKSGLILRNRKNHGLYFFVFKPIDSIQESWQRTRFDTFDGLIEGREKEKKSQGHTSFFC